MAATRGQAPKGWVVGDTIHMKGDATINKKKMEYVCAAWANANVKGIFLGRGAGKNYRVQWISLPDKPTLEYGGRHPVFKDPTANMRPATDDTRISNPAERAAKQPRNGASSSQGPIEIYSDDDSGDDLSNSLTQST